ncbi:MAG TPA: GNAT family N-acetyltransferase [Thermoanaerobaculia bacterium]|nr:GNAT family N-acetyltransferase [Thermoanaerobaculia bacterium]
MFLLETDRLLIRPWQPDTDRDAFRTLMSDPNVTRYIHNGEPFTEQEIDDWFARQARQIAEFDLCMGAATEKSTNSVVGIAGIQPLGTTSDLELGWIFSPHTWGRGYATEAGTRMMAHVFDTLARPRAVAIIDPDNEPSKRVAARLGMQYESRYTGAQLGYRKPEIVVDLFFRMRPA